MFILLCISFEKRLNIDNSLNFNSIFYNSSLYLGIDHLLKLHLLRFQVCCTKISRENIWYMGIDNALAITIVIMGKV